MSKRRCSRCNYALAYPRSAAPRALALNDLIAALDEQLRRILGDAIMLRWLPAANLCAIRADPAQIAQILINLVLNAREAMPDGGLLTLATANVTRGADAAGGSQPGDGVLLTITDTGAGMEAEVLAQLFEPVCYDQIGARRTRDGAFRGLRAGAALRRQRRGRQRAGRRNHGQPVPAARARAGGIGESARAGARRRSAH